MNRLLRSMAVLILTASLASAAGVTPRSVTITNSVTDTVAAVSASTYQAGSSLLFTNCVLKGAGGTTMDVAGVTVTVKIGTFDAAASYTATTNTVSSNWWALVTIPTTLTDRETCYVQVTAMDGTNSVVYPLKTVNFTQGL